MSYFTTQKVFLLPSLDLEVKQKAKIDRFLQFLEKSNIANIIKKYINHDHVKGGRPGYNYYRLFATILYGFAFDSYTLRDLEEACRYDLRYIYLMEQATPKYTKFCDYINKVIVPNEEEIFSLICSQIMREININYEDAFIDGTKYEANSNKYKFVWKPITFHKRLSISCNKIIKEHNLITNYVDEEMIRSSTIAFSLSNLSNNKLNYEEKEYKALSKSLSSFLMKTLEYEEKELICGPNRNSYYKTDKDATAMALKSDYYAGLGSTMHAAYNVQILVMNGFVFSYLVSQNRTDNIDFIDIINKFAKNYSHYPKRICADAGYGTYQNYKYMKERNIESYVKHQSWEGIKSGRMPNQFIYNLDNTITCLNQNIGHEVNLLNRHHRKANTVFFKINGCNKCNYMPYCKRFMNKQDEDYKIFELNKEFELLKQESHSNLCTIKGIELRINRSIQVEGVFGITKQDHNYVRFRRRGLNKASTEIMLNSLGFNVAKLFKYFETNKINKYWSVPNDIQIETFKQPSYKKINKLGIRIRNKMMEGIDRKKRLSNHL